MKMHNNYTIISKNAHISAYNSVLPEYLSEFISGADVLKTAYIFCGSAEFTAPVKFLSGETKNGCLFFQADFNNADWDNLAITHVGIGSENACISKAELQPFEASGRLVVYAQILLSYASAGVTVLSPDFLRMLCGHSYNIRAVYLSAAQKAAADFSRPVSGGINAALEISGGARVITPQEGSDKEYALITLDNQPAALIDLGTEYINGEAYTAQAKNFYIDTGAYTVFEGAPPPNAQTFKYGARTGLPKRAALLTEGGVIKSSQDGNYFTVQDGETIYLYSVKDGAAEALDIFGGRIDAQNIACHAVSENGLFLVYNDGSAKILSFQTGQTSVVPKIFNDALQADISRDLNFIAVYGQTYGYYYFINTGEFEQYYLSSQTYLINTADNTAVRFFSGYTVHYNITGTGFSYITTAANIFAGYPLNKLLSCGYYLFKNEGGIAAAVDHAGGIALLGGDGAQVIAVSASRRYFLVRYPGGAIRLFRFSKAHSAFAEFSYARALEQGEYTFLGDDKLLRLSKTAEIYAVDEDCCEIRLTQQTGAFSVRNRAVNKRQRQILLKAEAVL